MLVCLFPEIKYDGERVQLHKQGDQFKYFSRSLKPVLAHKVSHFKEFIPKAFAKGDDMILDGEVLMVDNNTGKPLPFGTLGVHNAAGKYLTTENLKSEQLTFRTLWSTFQMV